MSFLRYTLLSTLLFFSANTFAENVDSVLLEHSSLWQKSFEWRLANPALQYGAYQSALSTISYSFGLHTQQQHDFPENGLSERRHTLKATAYIPLSNISTAWGAASYSNASTKSVLWSSIVDYDLLYPHTIADSLGGDNRSEQYSFMGGYAQRLKSWRLGGQMNFRAEQAFRQRDPRMRSIVSDLTLSLGASYSTPKTVFALNLDGLVYKQNNDVSSTQELHAAPEYIMTGLGNHIARFSSIKNNVLYHGEGYRLMGSLSAPTGKSGLYATALWESLQLERISNSNNDLPLSTLFKNKLSARLGYRHNGSVLYDVAILGELLRDRGDEHIIGDGSHNDYPVLATLTMYYRDTKKMGLALLFGREATWNYYLKLDAGLQSHGERYEFPESRSLHKELYSQVFAQAIVPLKRGRTLTAELGAFYQKNLSKTLVLPLADLSHALQAFTQQRYQASTADMWRVSSSIRWDNPIGKSPYTLFCSLQSSVQHVLALRYQTEITVGLRF